MKTIIALALVLAATLAHASGDLAVPNGKQAMAKSPPPTVLVPLTPAQLREACVARQTAKCEAATWTKLGKRACIRWRTRACR